MSVFYISKCTFLCCIMWYIMNWKLSNEFFSRICNLTFMLSFHHRRVATQVTNERIFYNKSTVSSFEPPFLTGVCLLLIYAHVFKCLVWVVLFALWKIKFWKFKWIEKILFKTCMLYAVAEMFISVLLNWQLSFCKTLIQTLSNRFRLNYCALISQH